jgi:hypothetical protein
MKDMLAHFKHFCREAAECEIAKLAKDDAKRELFVRLSGRYKALADGLDRETRNDASSD